ncbi:MAG: sulfatase-like hydrolase/transferase, partial [Phycisphaeraceae bacterium]|nr:sulfatase-like hydrolase/transferase [Phycisphaeraceae bacterium]
LHNTVTMATMIQAVDDGVGQIQRTLDELNLTDNTIVVFFSDNGGVAKVTDMAPLRGYKGTYYEGGIREPFFVKWPGVVKPGSTCDEPIIGVDLYPTFCDMVGAKYPKDQAQDGVNLVPLLKGEVESLAERALFWHFPAYLQVGGAVEGVESRDALFRSRPCSIIRLGDWKLHQYFEDGGLELYNLKLDIGETTNLAQQYPKKRQVLLQQLLQWRDKVGAPVPSEPNPAFDAKAEAAALKSRRASRM